MQKNVSVSYKAITMTALFICATSMRAMEDKRVDAPDAFMSQDLTFKKSSEGNWWSFLFNGEKKETSKSDLVTQQELDTLTNSVMLASGIQTTESSLKSSSGGWFSPQAWSDWVFGVDSNVITELNKGTLTKDVVAQDSCLQDRVSKGIKAAIENKRTEKLCDLLNQLGKFEMLALYTDHNESITQFLNQEINGICEQKNCVKLMDILNIMKVMKLTVDSSLHNSINDLLQNKKDQNIQAFKNINQKNKDFVASIGNELEKSKELFKEPLLEAKTILLLQHYIAGESTDIESKHIKEKLNLTEDEQKLNALMKALNKFADKK